MKFDSDRAYDALIRSGDDWADKDAAASILEETKKSVLAKLVNALAGSMAARKSLALADPVYTQHLELMVEARREAIKSKVRYDSAKTLADMRRPRGSLPTRYRLQ